MKVLITGGLGFIGSHLAEALRDEYDVTIVDNLSNNKVHYIEWTTLIVADIRKFKSERYYDYVIHLAAVATITDEFSPELYDVNILGFNNIYNNLNYKNFIYASSAAAINKRNDYGKTKAFNEAIALNSLGFRFFNVYGKRDNGVVGKLMKDGATIYGGHQTRDFIYIKDVVRTIKENLNAKGIIEVGTGKEISVKTIADIIKKNYTYKPFRTYEEERSVCTNPICYQYDVFEGLRDMQNE